MWGRRQRQIMLFKVCASANTLEPTWSEHPAPIAQAVKAACASVNAALGDERRCGLDASQSGATACLALVAGSQLLIANAGSRSITVPQHGEYYIGFTREARADRLEDGAL